VGPVRPIDFSKTRWCPQPEAVPATVFGPTVVAAVVGGPSVKEAEIFLRQVERNLTALTHVVPMAEIEDLPRLMKPHVFGVPWT
jgi:hypothetical protein